MWLSTPPPRLREDLKEKARWLNFYDPDDILGYPLKPISEGYAEVVTRDIAINAGGVFSSWNPLSHNGYWTDNDLTKPVADLISSFLQPRATSQPPLMKSTMSSDRAWSAG